MSVRWSDDALNRWTRTADYIGAEWGARSLRNFHAETREAVSLLSNHPEMAPIEPLLMGCSVEMRSWCFSKYSKLIFFISNDTLNIIDVWDTRREPNIQATSVQSAYTEK